MNERLSLQDLTDLLAKKQEMTKKDAETFLRELIAVITENIEANESVKIKDFGTFKLVKVNARKSVDVNTGEAIEIAAHYKLSFNPDKLLKEAVNRPFAHFESVVLEEGVTFENIESEVEDEKEEDIEEDATVEEDVTEDIAIESATVVVEEIVEIVKEQPAADVTETETPEEEIAENPEIEVTETAVEEENIPETAAQPIGIINTNIAEEGVVEELAGEVAESELATEEEIIEPEAKSTPDDIITKIQKEAASRNVDLEDILLVLKEDKLKDRKLTDKAIDDDEDGDLVYEDIVPPRTGIRKRYITLAFFAFLIVAGFVIGGLYFQEIAQYLTNGSSNNEDITKMAELSDVEPPLVAPVIDSITKETDSIPVSPATNVHSQDQGKDLQAPPPSAPVKQAKAVAPSVSADSPLAVETIQSGHTLRNIALKYYGNKSFWVYIYEENKSKIKNINNVPLGTKLTIPARAKYKINPEDKESVKKAREKEAALFEAAEGK